MNCAKFLQQYIMNSKKKQKLGKLCYIFSKEKPNDTLTQKIFKQHQNHNDSKNEGVPVISSEKGKITYNKSKHNTKSHKMYLNDARKVKCLK